MTSSSAQSSTDTIRAATKVTLVGMLADIALGFAKIIGGMLGNSFALVTDGIHSLTDALSDVFVIVMARIGQAAPDTEHPWGHGRFETVGTIAMGMLFFSTAGILVYDSLTKLWSEELILVPTATTMAIAVISIAMKEWLYHYTMGVANKLNSSLLRANAWHSRSDALSSIAVAIGIGGALLGYPWMDTVAALFVALIIAKIGWELCLDALKELVDTQIPKPRRDQLIHAITRVEGVQGLSNFRSRSSGGKIILEISITVLPDISVAAGHAIGSDVAQKLLGEFSDIADVLFHIDTYEQENLLHAELSMPPLDTCKRLLQNRWNEYLSEIELEEVRLLRTDAGIAAVVTLDRKTCEQKLLTQIGDAIADLDYIKSLTVCTKAHVRKYDH
ncbi:MAG: cation diffusion facilitator family transporter [Pseudohongiellaceae bacterium]